ncbi:MAG TPA: YdeI/OmpD-associated family protein [Dyella sp.]|uniref:YdeI/OmpD-associated family protein n=1 Tax=Dyella sp. TaxID=1869338 RepID=UPI002D776554|nr:YdeI/OmpD-associated family protein [Dyella sp.]HET6554485.1 YdeI/OmpD-associated family protein [Dyella sp.]
MGSHDPRIDVYIAKAAPFAQPILEHLRGVIHEACPEVEEGIKWSMPFFSYQGALLCNMAAFKQHCSFGFWLHKEVVGEERAGGMGQFGKITSLKELPPKKTLIALVRKGMSLSDGGAKPRRVAKPKTPLSVPDDLAAALTQRKHAAARKIFEGFPPSAQREYVEWITEAKTETTRQKRLASTLEWLAEGKRRNWKYESC